MLSENRFNFKSGLKDVQLNEIAEAEAILSRTDQTQLEMVHKRLNYNFFLLCIDFSVKRKSESATM
jgi:hypothetical protein